jgi:hypothetical protein
MNKPGDLGLVDPGAEILAGFELELDDSLAVLAFLAVRDEFTEDIEE